MKRKKFIYIFAIIIFAAGAGGLIYFLLTSKKATKTFEALKEEVKEEPHEDELEYYLVDGQIVQKKFYDLYMKNKDFIGWINIKDTPIDYPVMHNYDDEEKYLHMDFDGNYSYAGCIFASLMSDINTPSDNIILYGHHMNTQIMFAPVMNYEDQEYADKHKYIQFDTLRENATYEVFAAYRTQIYPADYTGFVYYTFNDAYTKEEYDNYIKNVADLSVLKTGELPQYGQQILTLSTCAYHTWNGRFVVVAKKIDSQKATKQIYR